MHRAKIRIGENGNLRGRCDKDTAALALKTESPNRRIFVMPCWSLLSDSLLNFDWCCVQFRGAAMFNIVKRRDFMLGQDVATAQEAEQRLRDQYDCDYIVVNRADVEPVQEPQSPTLTPPR